MRPKSHVRHPDPSCLTGLVTSDIFGCQWLEKIRGALNKRGPTAAQGMTCAPRAENVPGQIMAPPATLHRTWFRAASAPECTLMKGYVDVGCINRCY